MNAKKIKKIFLDLIIEDKTSPIAIPFIAISLSLITASVFLLILGFNPVDAFRALLQASGFMAKDQYAVNQGMLTDFTSFLGILAPMMLATLGVIIAMRAGLFNIGISGQMLAAGFIATVLVGYTDLDSIAARPLVMLIGAAAGASVGALIGFLKYKFNIHEVVSSIMLNHIIMYVTAFFINRNFVDPFTRSSVTSSPESRLTITGYYLLGIQVTMPIGILLAIVGVIVVKFILDKTVLGFEIKMIGMNRNCARYSGMNVNALIMKSMTFSGAFAGLAGVTYYLGFFNTIITRNLADLGFNSIASSLLANLNPIGSIYSSILITILENGSIYMSSATGAPREIVTVVIGIMMVFSACGIYIRHVAKRAGEKLNITMEQQKEG